MQYELKVAGKAKPIVWDGVDGVDAAQRYAGSHPGSAVIAWRDYPRTSFVTPVDVRSLPALLIEPGHPRYGKPRRKGEVR